MDTGRADGPTYGQIQAIGHWTDDFLIRIVDKLRERQQRGPTRISGMDIELDKAAQDAIREWADELESQR